MLSFAFDKVKLFSKNFSKNSNLDDSGISLPAFPLRTNLKLHNFISLPAFPLNTNLKLHNFHVTPKLFKVITNLNLSKVCGPNCIPVVVLKKCEPELSYMLPELFNKCLKECCFLDCWKVSFIVPVFKNVLERSLAKNYCSVSLISVVSKVFESFVNNRLVDQLEKCTLLFNSQYGFRSSRSTADKLRPRVWGYCSCST